TTYNAPILSAGNYFWHVRAISAQGANLGVAGAWSATQTFTLTSAPPVAPSLLSPVQGSSVSTTHPALSWQAVQGAKSYDVQVANASDPLFASPVVKHSGISTATYTLAATETLNYGSLYYWHIRAVNVANDAGAWSSPFQFTVTVHKTPANGSS